MPDDGDLANKSPLNWCFDCGKPLWVYSGARRTFTLLGPVVLCADCAQRHPGHIEMDWSLTAIGWKDKQHWKGAPKRRTRR